MARPQFLEALRQQVVQSFVPGERLPSQRELARVHEVGLGTVHRALKNLTEEGLVRAVPRMGWVRAEAKTADTNGEARTGQRQPFKVGLITKSARQHWGTSAIFAALLREARRRGVEVVEVANPRSRGRTVERYRIDLARVPWNTFEVGLLVGMEDTATLTHPLLKQRTVLALDQDATALGLDSVAFADAQAGAMAAQYLFDLGHRRFAVTDEVNDPGFTWEPAWTARRHGFEAMIGRLGGVLKPEWRVSVRHHGWRTQDCVGPTAWASAPSQTRPTALFATCSFEALAILLDQLSQSGLRIPQDLSAVTVTWNQEIPSYRGLRLTCVDMDLGTLVRKAFDVAEELAHQPLAQENSNKNREARLFSAPGLLVPGQTSVAPPS